MIDIESFSYAFVLGFVPAMVWLTFWLLQDRKRPEPRALLARAFFVGMLAVICVIPLQKIAIENIPGASLAAAPFVLILVWAAIEEVMKLFLAWIAVLRHRAVDEPIDIPVYLITVALGFAALENTLFLLTPLGSGEFLTGLITGNLRFLGATLIHVLSSAIIGGALAFAYYEQWGSKLWYGFVGVILATLLHALFNFSIIHTGADYLLTVFTGVWVGVMFLLIALEQVKLLQRPQWWRKMFIIRKK